MYRFHVQCFLALLLLGVSSTQARADLYVKVEASSKAYTQEIAGEYATQKRIVFWFPSTGNISSALDLYVEGPSGAKVTVYGVSQGAKSEQEVLVNSKSLYPLILNTGSSTLKSFTFQSAAAARYTPTSSAPTTLAANLGYECKKLPPEVVQGLLATFRGIYGASFSEQELCADADSANGNFATSNLARPDNLSKQFITTFSKDTCSGNAKSKYLVAVEFDLTGAVAPAAGSTHALTVAARERKFEGARAASIKPFSDGKFQPRPLVLMSSVSDTDQISLVRWSRGKAAKRTNLKFAKRLYYQGYILTSALIDNVLRGGKGTFEISDGTTSYSVCFRLKRTRQKVNGYPGGG